MDWFGSDMWLTWVGIAVVLLILELFSGELILLTLGMSGFVAAAVAGVGLGLPWQLAAFGVASVALLSLVRPKFTAKLHAGPSLPAGQHGLVGEVAVVSDEVHKLGGRIKVGDVFWTARPTSSAERMAVGEFVVIDSIDGAVAHVRKKEQA